MRNKARNKTTETYREETQDDMLRETQLTKTAGSYIQGLTNKQDAGENTDEGQESHKRRK